MTPPLRKDGEIDTALVAPYAEWLIGARVHGVAATVEAVRGRIP
jgi:dihydrodipicolinate synthase/N-acetylneuraminate lyase